MWYIVIKSIRIERSSLILNFILQIHNIAELMTEYQFFEYPHNAKSHVRYCSVGKMMLKITDNFRIVTVCCIAMVCTKSAPLYTIFTYCYYYDCKCRLIDCQHKPYHSFHFFNSLLSVLSSLFQA